MTTGPINRDDQAFAESVMRRACPDGAARSFLMEQLLRSIALAETSGPGSWAVTLFHNGFRLNVGQVEAFTYLNRVVRFFMLGSVPTGAYTLGEVLECSFRSMPRPQFAFYGSARELERLGPLLAGGHEAFVEAAATTSAGKPRRCPYSRYHSPGLYNYAVQLTGSLAPKKRPKGAAAKRPATR